MGELVRCRGTLTDKGHGHGEDAVAALAGLDGAGCEGAAVTDTLDMVEDWDGGGSSEEEVAVTRMDEEVLGDGALACCYGLGDDDTTIDAAGTGRVPWWPCVCEYVLCERYLLSILRLMYAPKPPAVKARES